MSTIDPEAWMDTVAPALGLRIEPEWRPGVAGFLKVAAGMAALVEAVVDDGMTEAAPVYRPGEVARTEVKP